MRVSIRRQGSIISIGTADSGDSGSRTDLRPGDTDSQVTGWNYDDLKGFEVGEHELLKRGQRVRHTQSSRMATVEKMHNPFQITGAGPSYSVRYDDGHPIDTFVTAKEIEAL